MESDDGNCAPISPIRLHLNRKNKKEGSSASQAQGCLFVSLPLKNGVSGKGF